MPFYRELRYRVTLHFAEVWLQAPRLRRFDVMLEGKPVLEDYEPYAAGFAAIDAHSFDTAVGDGILDLEFTPHVGDPMVAAIEITRLP